MAPDGPTPEHHDVPAAATPRLQWIGAVDGHLEFLLNNQAANDPRRFTSPHDIHRALQDLQITNPHALRTLAAFGMFLAARDVPVTSQAAILIDALRTTAASLNAARPGISAIASSISDMLDVALQHRAVGVRQLHVRLLHEAAATLSQ